MSKLIGILGDRGAGKTLFMTYLLRQDHIRNGRVVANYHLYFPEDGKHDPIYLPFKKIAKLPPQLRDASVGLDELQIGTDSRRSLSDDNIMLTKLVTQMRKRNLDVYYTTQRYNMIDKRIKNQTDYLILMERYPCLDDTDEDEMKNTTNPRAGMWFRYQVLDNEFLDTLNKGDDDGWRYFKAGKAMFDLYDTTEIIDYDEEGEEGVAEL